MVIAQYTGVSLQKDDRAFIRYDEYSNTWNQASLTDAFATVPYHAKGDSYWKDEWRNFHVRASEDAFIQNVSIFAVGFADHFLMESGGDMSITNSNSNFGNTSLHAIGFKGFAFNQDKGGYITDIIPPKKAVEGSDNIEKIAYYTVDIQGTIQSPTNYTKLFLGSDDIIIPAERPAATIDGYRLGAKSNDKLYVKLDPAPGTGEVFNVELEPTGFLKYIAKGSILNPTGISINGVYADAANLIESNRRMIQEEVFGYILEKYPRLQNIPYVNPGLDPAAGRYFDARNLILANRQEIVDTAFNQMVETFGIGNIQGVADGKCKRDIGFIVDAIAEDLRDGGNINTIEATKFYFNGDGTPLQNGLVGEENYAVFAFNRARDLCKKAIANLLTVKATIYDPDPTSILAPYGVVAGSTGSAALGLTSDGVTVDESNKQDPAGRYKDARNLIVDNREFILDAALAEVAVYHPDFYMPGDTQSNVQSRFADAYRLIRRNSKEIADRALAKIAVDYPDFYFPGDAQTTADSRFYDSYRLIQQNKTEIVNTAWTNMVALYPGVASTETKCKRDLGYFVDAISLDLFIRGNEYSYRFAAEYFSNATTPISNGLVGEVTESVYAFNQAKTLMKSAVTNQLTVKDLTITADPATGSNTNANSCANVRSAIDTLSDVVTTIITAGNLNSLPLEINKGSAPAGMKKCARDIGYFIDAIAVDVFTGGNKHTRKFTQQYFVNATTPISNGLVGETAQSNTAFNEAAEFMRQAVTNQLYYKDLTITADPATGSNTNVNSCANVKSAITTLAGVVTTAIGAGNLNSLPAENAGTFLTGETKCRRDIGHIVDAVAQDLWFGGNEYTIAATKEYFTNATTLLTNGVAGETGPSITAFRRAQDLMNRAVNNQYYNRDLTITLDNTDEPAVFSDIHSNVFLSIMDNKKFIAKEAYQRMKLAYPSYAPQPGNTEQDCLDDVYDVLEQIAYDVKFGGNSKTYDAANVYVTNTFNGQPVQTFIDPERDEAAKVFLEAKKVTIDIINNVTVTPTAGNTETQVFDFTQTLDWDADELLPRCGSAVAAVDTLFGIIIQAIGNDGGVGNLTGITRTAPVQPTTYALGNCSDVLATIDTLISVVVDALYAGNLNTLPPLSNGEWDCANVRSTIENLFDIVTDAISTGSLAGLPTVNPGDFITNATQSKCFRDVSYIVDALVNDLRLGGNINSIQAGEAYYVGNSLTYIDGEKPETIDAWNYVGQLATAAMRNFDVLAVNCVTTTGSAIVNVADTRGIVIGMRVVEYATSPTPYVNGLLQPNAVAIYSNIPEGTFVKRIVSNNQIELGVANSRLDTGNTVNALQSSTTTRLYFTFEKGQWANTLPRTVTVGPAASNPDVIQDTQAFTSSAPTQRECAGVANAIETLIGNITTIINSGLGTVARQEQTVNTALLSSRATVFTIDTTGYGSTNAHNFETGTPVRLVPRPRFDVTTGKYVEVDKRLVRLPKGFEPNRTYYVIAPGRRTQPEDYSNTTFFNGSDQTKLMLATSRENAAAGIYIYASETANIDPNVEIDLYQFVLDDKYTLHNYKCNLTNTVNAGIETDVSHIFDVPSASTTPHRVFFRAIEGGQLPLVASTYANDATVAVTNPQNANVGRINPQIEFFARYQNDKVFTIHKTHADAINNVNPITFASGQAGVIFDVFSNKRRSPMRFDPAFTDAVSTTGKWYIQCKDQVTAQPTSVQEENIFWRLHQSDYSDRPRTTDMWYERLEDTREADDRTYKIRYVIPKYLENARDPINGFVLKTRTDDTRKLIPQKILLKPVTGSVYGARFENPVQAGEYIGYTEQQFELNSLNKDAAYDPYKKDLTGQGIEYRAFARFTSGIQATIQGGRYVTDQLDPNIKYLELTVYDHAVDARNFPGLRNELFTTVKITAPQGGSFVTNKTQSITANQVAFSGYSSGLANIHAYYSVGGDHYLIIKNIRGGKLEYSEYDNVRFTQGTVFADMLEDQDMGKSLPLKTLIRKGYPEYYWRQNGANVYTITPGDRIQDDAGIEYYVEKVEDAGIIEDTFYIFASETLQRRIAGQQDGIYYLTALRGNISPFPTGAGVINNFKNFKFSQPVSRLYPLNYRNDPLWFQKNGTTNEEKDYYAALIDPPQAFSAADNYTHGLVTVNDYKNSVTRELVGDLVNQPAFIENEYTGGNAIEAQEGNATSGSEDRRIPIAGNSTVLTDQKYYVELRRPSIARAGNHTFEYLGFGPGNYSTGLPARQEVVLTPDQDFYAQSKKQDAGIVFYTGINSQGDLYIGNRRINAITGEETFIDAATLQDDGDENDVIGGLVTTFDTPVTFNQNITIVGGDGSLVSSIEAPLVIAVQDEDLTQQRDVLIIRSNVSSVDPVTQLEQDEGLDRTAFRPPTAGDVRISKNRVQAAIFGFNARGNGQAYMFQTHTSSGIPSNLTPNQTALIAQGGTRISSAQFVTYGGVQARPGDVLLKGTEIGKTGSLGWILANYYQQIPNGSIFTISFDGSNVVKLTFRSAQTGVNISNQDIGITSGSQIRVNNFYYDPRLNLTWIVYSPPGDAFSPTNNYVHFQVIDQIPQAVENWADIIAGTAVGAPAPSIEFSNASWKEVGVLGAEALRTETEAIGNYKLGINTIARAPHSAHTNAFVDPATTDPRANLDVVGKAYISGKTLSVSPNNYLSNSNPSNRTFNSIADAFVVGGDSLTPTNYSALRVDTRTVAITEAGRGNNLGRIGINTDETIADKQLNRALVVVGDARFTEDVRFQRDIEVHGNGSISSSIAEIRTNIGAGTFNLVTDNSFVGTLNIGNKVENIYIGDTTTEDQFIIIGSDSLHSNILLGVTPDARPGDNALTISKVEIGGAYLNNESQSFTRIKTKSFKVDGDFQLGARRTINDTVRLSTTAGTVSFFSDSGSASTVDFALNASEINIAGQGGTTTINNQLEVIASAKFNGDVVICGGVASFSFVGSRGQLGSAISAHEDGVINETTFNKNIDIVNVLVKSNTDEGYNEVDTAGSGAWGGITFQAPVLNIGGTPVVEPQDLPALTGNEYYLPLLNAPLKLNGEPYFVENDYIIINSAAAGSTHPEILQIVELTRISVAPYYIKVRRQPIGTFTAIKTNHPDRTPIYKVNIQFDSTWTEQSLDNTGPTDNVYLAEFGGSLTNNDYVIIDRTDTNSDGVFDQGEVIKVVTPLEQQVQKFRVSSDCSSEENDVFVVNSVTGEVLIGNPDVPGSQLTLNSTLQLSGGCGTLGKIQFTATATASSTTLTGVVVTSAGKTINDIQIGDYIHNITNQSPIEFDKDTKIVGINSSSNEIYLSAPSLGSASVSATFEARRNEKLTVTNGQGITTFEVDTCTGTTHIGSQYGRIEIEYAISGNNTSLTTTSSIVTAFDTGVIKKAYGYWYDPQIAAEGGPDTTVRAAATGSAGQVQVPVQTLGVGTGEFDIDDLVFIGTPSAASTGVGTFVIGKIVQVITDPTNPTIVIAAPGDGIDTSVPLVPGNSVFAVGNVVRRVIKHREFANIIDVEMRTRVISGSSTQYCSIILDRGYIVQQKLDYQGWIALANDSGAQMWASVEGRLQGVVHETTMNEQRTDGAIPYRTGRLEVADNVKLIGGSFEIYDSVNQTRLFGFVNDDGHADHQGLLIWDAGVVARGDFFLFSGQDPENVITDPYSVVPTFSVDNLGNVTTKTTLTVSGVAQPNPSTSLKQLSVENLGSNGSREFSIKQDGSINSFGLENFYTSSGARHTRYISASSPEEDLTLIPNIMYMVNVQAAQTLVLTLPTAPVTGDIVRIVEVGGNLNFNTSLVLRTAESSGVRIQGDATGTLLGGRITPYPSGELVVQTANAAFGLIYLGGTDSNGQVGIPTAVQGWWLMEV
jgi:hypothetical protein